MNAGIIGGLCLTLALLAQTAQAKEVRCFGYQYRNAFAACTLKKLSWVEVKFFNEISRQALKKNSEQIENDIRGYARRAFPMLRHEIIDPKIIYLFSHDDKELLRKAKISCLIGVTKNENATLAAVYVQCKLYTFWALKELQIANFQTALLGIMPSAIIDKNIDKKYIKNAIEDLGRQFSKSLSQVEQSIESRNKSKNLIGKSSTQARP